MSIYSALAKRYEYFLNKDEEKKWCEYVIDKVKEYSLGKSGIDCGCGTGIITRALSREGYSVVGVDVSEEMLSEAVSYKTEGKPIEYRLGDMKNLKNFHKVNFITAINDGINYLNEEDLKKCFKSFSKCLNVGGALIFDFSSEYKLKNVLGNNLYAEDGEEASYIWFNTLYEDRVEIDFTLFSKKGSFYEKSEEFQTQYIHRLDDVISYLIGSGFEVKERKGHLGEEINEKTERFSIVAIKR